MSRRKPRFADFATSGHSGFGHSEFPSGFSPSQLGAGRARPALARPRPRVPWRSALAGAFIGLAVTSSPFFLSESYIFLYSHERFYD